MVACKVATITGGTWDLLVEREGHASTPLTLNLRKEQDVPTMALGQPCLALPILGCHL